MTIWPAWQNFEENTKGSVETGKLADLVILSGDPTAVDPETLAQLKVVETIKEGQTVFALTEEKRKLGDLMLKPNRDGSYAFARFLRAAAVNREFLALPAARRTPEAHAMIESAPHDASCYGPVLNELVMAAVQP